VIYVSTQLGKPVSYGISSNRPIRNAHRQKIVELLNWQPYKSSAYRSQLIKYAKFLAQSHVKPMFVFTELARHLTDLQIELPQYSEIQRIVSEALRHQEDRLIKLLENVPVTHKRTIDRLLEHHVSSGDFNLQDIIELPKSLSNGEISDEIKRFNSVSELYYYACDWLKNSTLTPESINYYASLVQYYGRGRLAKMTNPLIPLYIMCFVVNRCKRINDNLIDTFHSLLNKYKSKANDMADELQSDSHVFFEQHEAKFAKVMDLFINKSKPETSASKLREKAFKTLDDNAINVLIDYMQNRKQEKRQLKWQSIAKLEPQFKNNLRLIFKHICIDYRGLKALKNATEKLNDYFKLPNNDDMVSINTFVTEIVSKQALNLITEVIDHKPLINPKMYEFYLYTVIDQALYSGEISSDHSHQFMAYEDEIIKDEELANEVIQKLNLTTFDQPITTHLDALEEKLENQIKQTNNNIYLGNNDAIQIKSQDKRTWTLPYRKDQVSVNHKIFESMPTLDIADVISYVDQETQFLSCFQHILHKGARKPVDKKVLTAVLLGKATNHGLHQMGSLSDFDYDTLKRCEQSYISLEAVKEACDTLSNAIKELPVFNLYNINDCVHGGIDGQKSKPKKACFNARHSPKYFYLGKGISTATLLVNHIPANATIFGAHEHESRFIFDLIYNNDTEIQPDIISTDSHGCNCVNFALLDFFGRQFAPCFKRINNKESMIAGFNEIETYEQLFIRPSGQINRDLIETNWIDIKKIVASLALKKSNQSTLIRMLTNSSYENPVKEALWEYDKIIRSEYILRYIDDEQLRRSVRTALNRNEAYHQLKNTIRHIGNQNILGKNDDHVVINDECARLLSEVIIYYNASILTELLQDNTRQDQEDLLKYSNKVSLVAWCHVNLHGIYRFKNKGRSAVDVSALIKDVPSIIVDQDTDK
jgi:TnpA family transposase